MRSILILFFAALYCLPASGASLAVLGGGEAVVVATFGSELQYWKRSAVAPSWTLKLNGLGLGARSPIAALSGRADGNIVVVERYGRILLISKGGTVLTSKRPVFENVWLNVPFEAVNWSNWSQQVKRVASTSAAQFSNRGTMVLAPDGGTLRELSVDSIIGYPGGLVYLTNQLGFFVKGSNVCFNRSIDVTPVKSLGSWDVTSKMAGDPTAVALCRSTVIAGTEGGSVLFIPESGAEEDLRLRQVGTGGSRPILDAGCLSGDLAYTVSVEAGNGQIQLWSLETKAALHWVGFDSGSHSGMAFVGVPSVKGDALMSIGDHDVRLWSVKERRLKLIAEHFFDDSEDQAFAGGALSNENFLYWDGKRVWTVPISGAPPTIYAGKQ